MRLGRSPGGGAESGSFRMSDAVLEAIGQCYKIVMVKAKSTVPGMMKSGNESQDRITLKSSSMRQDRNYV